MKTKYLLVCLVSALVLMSCSKDGETGSTGPAGPAGEPGNANVTVYNFGSRTFTGTTTFTIPVSQGRVDSSIVLAYYNPSTEVASAWYPIPGMGSLGVYETRFVFYQSTPPNYLFAVRLTTGGTTNQHPTAVTFTKTRVFIVPASTLISGRNSPAVDVADYHAVCRFYNISE
jgi:hypothetical protein